jgi:hypothetical protein
VGDFGVVMPELHLSLVHLKFSEWENNDGFGISVISPDKS